jgi:hypothetical protein
MIKINSLRVDLVAENLGVLKSILAQGGLKLRKSKSSEAWMIVKPGDGYFEILLYTATHDKETLLAAVADVLSNPNTKWRVMMAGHTATKVPTLVREDQTTMEDLKVAIATLKKS